MREHHRKMDRREIKCLSRWKPVRNAFEGYRRHGHQVRNILVTPKNLLHMWRY